MTPAPADNFLDRLASRGLTKTAIGPRVLPRFAGPADAVADSPVESVEVDDDARETSPSDRPPTRRHDDDTPRRERSKPTPAHTGLPRSTAAAAPALAGDRHTETAVVRTPTAAPPTPAGLTSVMPLDRTDRVVRPEPPAVPSTTTSGVTPSWPPRESRYAPRTLDAIEPADTTSVGRLQPAAAAPQTSPPTVVETRPSRPATQGEPGDATDGAPGTGLLAALGEWMARVEPTPRAAVRPAAAPTPSRAEPLDSDPPPAVHVTIGRIDVRSPPPAAPRPAPASPPRAGLEDYLRRRVGLPARAGGGA